MTVAVATVSHALQDIVERVLALEDDPLLYKPEISLDDASAHARDKTFVALKRVNSYIQQINPLYVSVWGVAQVQTVIQNLFNEISAFISNGNNGHLLNAASQVDQYLYPMMWVFANWEPNESLRTTEVTIEKLNESATSTFQQLVEQRNSLEAQIASLVAQIDSQSTRLESMTTVISTQKSEAAAVTSAVQKAYTDEENSRSQAFNSNQLAMRELFEEIRLDMEKKSSNAISALEKSKTDAERIVGVIGNVGVTGNYQQIANKESEAAGRWRLITLAFFLSGIVLAIVTFIEFWGEAVTTANVSAIAIRLLYALAFAAPAFYTAKEAARHRTNSDRARQRELELASLGPFIELLPQGKKEEIREAMTKFYFGKDVEEHVNGSLFEIKELTDFILKLIKEVKNK